MKKNKGGINGTAVSIIIAGISRKAGDCLFDGSFVIKPRVMTLNVDELWKVIKNRRDSEYAALKKLCEGVIKSGRSTEVVTVKTTYTNKETVVYGCEFSSMGIGNLCKINSRFLKEIEKSTPPQTSNLPTNRTQYGRELTRNLAFG